MTSFSLDPIIPAPAVIGSALLTVPAHPNKLQAAAALRSYTTVAANGGELYPGLGIGRIQVPRNVLRKMNNIGEDLGEAMPMICIPIDMGDAPEGVLMIFRDRSALVAASETHLPAGYQSHQAGLHLYRLLPFALTLPRKILLDYSGTSFLLSLQERNEELFLLAGINSSNRPTDAVSSGRSSFGIYPNQSGFDEIKIIRALLAETARRWIRRIETSPLVHLVEQDTPKQGILGKDCESLGAQTDGLPYMMPVYLPCRNFSEDTFEKARTLFDLAFAHLWHRHKKDLERIVLRVTGAPRDQSGKIGKIRIQARAIPKDRKTDKAAIERRFVAAYRKLLKVGQPPRGLFELHASGQRAATGKPFATEVVDCTLYFGDSDKADSNHLRLQAYERFGDR